MTDGHCKVPPRDDHTDNALVEESGRRTAGWLDPCGDERDWYRFEVLSAAGEFECRERGNAA